MKKLNLIIVCLIYSIYAFGQEFDVMRFTLPKGTIKLNEKQLKGLIHNGFDEKMAFNFHDHVYKKGRLLFYYINAGTAIKMEKSLENRQMQMISLNRQITGRVVDTSTIITVNNIRFLVMEYHDKNYWYLWFSSDYDKSASFINGFIEYKKPDDAEARQYLHDLLGSMHFKDN